MTLDFSHNPADEDSDKLVAVQAVLRRVQAQAAELSLGDFDLSIARLYAEALEEIAVAVGFESGK